MGIITGLLLFPVKSVVWVAEKLAEQAENELYNEDAVRGLLAELEVRHELEEINDDEFEEAEEVLLQRMRDIRDWRAMQQRGE